MQRRTLFAWLAAFVFLLFLVTYFTEPVEEVLLGFDTEPIDSEEMIEFITTTLEQYGATATFFVTGEYAQQNPEIVTQLSATYEVACHTMTHPRLPDLNASALRWELEECKRVVENITNQTVYGFRAPYNLLDTRTLILLEELNYTYDASTFENLGWFYPKPTITELRISSLGFLPLQDYTLAYAMKLGDLAFFLMKQDKDRQVILNLHPQHVYNHRGAFQYLISAYADDGVTFTTHREAAQAIA